MSLDDTPVLALAEGFPMVTRDAWRALAEKTLKGATVDSLSRTIEGVQVQPLYDAGSAMGPRPPGRASGDAARPWDIRAPVSTREEALSALAGGASSILVAAVEPTEEVLADLLEGVLVDVAPIALDATGDGLDAAVALSRAVKSSPAAALAFHLDPIGQGGGEADLQRHAAGAATLATTHPRATLFLANGARIHDAGGEPAWELAFAVSCGVAYARALAEVGLETADAFGRVVLGFAVDNRPLINVAKLRAARLMWARVTGACGASVPASIEARSSFRMLTLADPWSNLVRLTQAGFAAAVGGADAIALYPHDRASGSPDPLGPRLARNASLILMEEAHLGAVVDPVAGAWAFEALTRDLAKTAWTHFNAIEAAGGPAEALASGMISEAVATSVSDLRAALGDRTVRIVGVTDFRAASDAPGEQPADTPPGGLAPIRLEGLAR